MNEKQFQSLKAVLAYLMPEELRHWEEAGKPSEHVYHDIKRLEHFTEIAAIPEDYNDFRDISSGKYITP